jgi:putative transcriptional regulator
MQLTTIITQPTVTMISLQTYQALNVFTLLLAVFSSKSDAFVPNLQRSVETRLYGKKVQTKKTTERAFNERNFESMMGNDWREFRAKLVAQEKAAALLRESTAYYHGSKLMAKHGRIGDLFAGSINIFDDRICGVLDCNDPFVSKDELPIIMQKEVSIDKHRWAHSIPRPEQGSILISNERFHQTVVLMISHCDKSGSSGVVINRYVNAM